MSLVPGITALPITLAKVIKSKHCREGANFKKSSLGTKTDTEPLVE